jgi:hypothetical protein
VSVLRIDKAGAFYSIAPLIVLLFARRTWLMPLLVLCIVASGLYVKAVCFPVLDRQVSARFLWKSIQPYSRELCDGGTNRDWIYGLNFYRGAAIPLCGSDHFRFMIRSSGHAQPAVVPLAPEPSH